MLRQSKEICKDASGFQEANTEDGTTILLVVPLSLGVAVALPEDLRLELEEVVRLVG